jgi:hypothetical protein
MEFDYYGAKVVASWLNAKLFTYCAGTSGVDSIIDEPHTLKWRSVLPIAQCVSLMVRVLLFEQGDGIEKSTNGALNVPIC